MRATAVIGTAGHVDHGKTALVRALTGTDTDRLPEEQRRGISIELGFAWLDRPGGRLAFIDVPGHERFVRQMIAGAAGIDAVMLVVAADEGVMPQTREHLEICRLLGVRAGLVALTRADLADADLMALAREDVAGLVAGTFLEGAPIIACSIHDQSTIDTLATALDGVVGRLERSDEVDRPFLLAVDRAFSRPGFGTIVTGTTRAGSVALGDDVAVWGGAEVRSARVRGLAIHGEPVDAAGPGQRLALNLAGVAVDEIARGARVARGLEPSSSWDVTIEAIARLPSPLRDGEKGLACFGATVVEATVGLLDGAELAPGASTWGQLRLAGPVALLPGERWVLRGFRALADGSATLAGGRVLAPSPRRRKRGQADAVARLERDLASVIASFIVEAGEGGVAWSRLHASLPASRGAIDREVSRAVGAASRNLIATSPAPPATLVSPGACVSLAAAIDGLLAAHHRDHPSSDGVPIDELRSRLRPSADSATFAAIVDDLVARGVVTRAGPRLARPGFSPGVATDERALDARVLAIITGAGLAPPRSDELPPLVGAPAALVEAALVRLTTAQVAVRVQKDVLFASTILDPFVARVREHFTREPWLDAQGLKDLTGVSRKWTIPLGEWLDRARVTVRVGDRRRLRG